MQDDFYQADFEQPHPERTRAILKAHPEVRSLMGRNPWTALIGLLVVAAQTGIAFGVSRLGPHGWWVGLLLAYGFGAFANHCTYVIIHDATHNLVFRSRILNKLVAIGADLPNLLPAAVSFGIYHLKHHAHQGDYEVDADIPNQWEARLVANKWYRKALWLFFFPIFQLTRPPRLKAIAMWNRWTVVNIVAVLGYVLAVYFVCGWLGLWYLGLSFFFSVGLHPVGARWIQEHYTLDPDQETFSYYGPINRVALNVGYHNEHHDFPSIAWNNLPGLRRLAPEFYDTLRSHSSWTRLLLQFVFDQRYNLFSRVERSPELAHSPQRPTAGLEKAGTA
jgi:sphingolipid 4-desaturase/C4-monooxygenase